MGDGSRVSKDHPRVEAYGTVDELNSVIGLLLTETIPSAIRECLIMVQHDLFDVGGELCIPGHQVMNESQVKVLEKTLDQLNAELSPLQEFILPGGCRAAALAHLARTVCRRAERRTTSLMVGKKEDRINEISVRYLNRLSDLLFVMARSLNRETGVSDVMWDRERKSEESND